jgi:peptide/nickel transport system substrate-binding protein
VFKNKVFILLAIMGIASLLTACNSRPIPPTANPAPITTEFTPFPDGENGTPPAAATPTQTKITRQLRICTGPEPVSLFPYVNLSAVTRSIHQAIYDGPIDEIDFSFSPVILQQIPTLENGDAFFEPAQVGLGDIIVDNNGLIVNLREGTVYRPSGCSSPDCAATYNGTGSTQIDRLVVRFQLLPGLKWSDGSPLTANDSVYAYKVAQELYPSYRPDLVRLTYSYQSLDQTSLEWRGLPGSQPPTYSANFYSPLPEQAWGGIDITELAASEGPSRSPLGWGPYVVGEWIPGQNITLIKNPHYFGANEGLPRFDSLVFTFTNSPAEAVQGILEGECDLADEVSLSSITTHELQQLKLGASLFTVPGGAWEQILFGINPASETHPAIFSSPEVRQAVATCIDRERIIDQLYPGMLFVPDSFVLPDHPLYNAQSIRYIYDPQAASDKLAASGWIDHDDDPGTPRLSQGVAGFQDGTPFEFSYLASNDPEREQTALMIQSDLAGCGIRMNLTLGEASEVYAGGPDGPIFGRQFDAAQLAWSANSELPCYFFSSYEIPGPIPDFPKGWGGANASGFNHPAYDRACSTSLSTLKDSPAYASAYGEAQWILAEQLPALPLYLHPRVAAARPDLCGFNLDPSTPNSLWNLEWLDYGETCTP